MRSADILYTRSWTATVLICSGSSRAAGAFVLHTGTADIFTSAAINSSRTITSGLKYSSRQQSNLAQRSLWTMSRPSASMAAALTPPRMLSEPLNVDVPPEKTLPRTPNVGIPPEKTLPRTPKAEKIALAIDSLNNYDLIKPIPVLIESLGDKVFVAESVDLNVSTTGDSVGAAFLLLKEQIITTYEGYRSRKGSDSERARQLAVFDQYIGKPRRHWF